MSDLRVWKAIFEVRFPATASLFDERGAIATAWQWQDDLTEWQISNNQVTIHNKPGTKFLRVGLRSAVTIYEHPSTMQEFEQRALEFTASVLTVLQPRLLERVGLRIIQIAPRKHFKLLTANMRKSLFALTDQDWSLLGGPAQDLAFPLVLTVDDKKANFNLGPMYKGQLESFFESSEVKQKLPEAALFVDFDLYKEEPLTPPSDYATYLADFVKSGCDKAITLTDSFMDRYKGFE